MFLVFDTETTGLIDNVTVKDDELPEVIEFYGALIEPDGTVVREVETLIKPRKAIPKEITKITGISNEDVRLSPAFDIAADEIISLIEASPAVVAHNLQYDVEVMNLEAQRCGRKIAWPRRKICTIEQTMHVKGYRMGLSDLHEHLFGHKFPGAHRARVDVEALIRCTAELIRRDEL